MFSFDLRYILRVEKWATRQQLTTFLTSRWTKRTICSLGSPHRSPLRVACPNRAVPKGFFLIATEDN
jgi:hypothetical protein